MDCTDIKGIYKKYARNLSLREENGIWLRKLYAGAGLAVLLKTQIMQLRIRANLPKI
jgi:hypothetical protein